MKKKNCQGKSILSSNKGFSLFEMLIVVAIMAIVTALASITYIIVHNANVARAANTLDTAFNKARVQSMAKGTEAGRLSVWVDNGVMYYTIGDDVDPIKINSTAISIAYSTSVTNMSTSNPSCASIATNMGSADLPIVYRFNSAGMVIPNPGGTMPYAEWIFFRGNRHIRVAFFLETGKHQMDPF